MPHARRAPALHASPAARLRSPRQRDSRPEADRFRQRTRHHVRSNRSPRPRTHAIGPQRRAARRAGTRAPGRCRLSRRTRSRPCRPKSGARPTPHQKAASHPPPDSPKRPTPAPRSPDDASAAGGHRHGSSTGRPTHSGTCRPALLACVRARKASANVPRPSGSPAASSISAVAKGLPPFASRSSVSPPAYVAKMTAAGTLIPPPPTSPEASPGPQMLNGISAASTSGLRPIRVRRGVWLGGMLATMRLTSAAQSPS